MSLAILRMTSTTRKDDSPPTLREEAKDGAPGEIRMASATQHAGGAEASPKNAKKPLKGGHF